MHGPVPRWHGGPAAGEAVLGQAECRGHDTRGPPVLGSSGPPELSMSRSWAAPTLPPCFGNLRRSSPWANVTPQAVPAEGKDVQ